MINSLFTRGQGDLVCLQLLELRLIARNGLLQIGLLKIRSKISYTV